METNKLTIEYIQFNGNIDAIREFIGKPCTKFATLKTGAIIVDLNGLTLISNGDYIIKFSSGVAEVLTEEEFELLYKTNLD